MTVLDVKKEADAFAPAFAEVAREGDPLLARRRAAFEQFAAEGYPPLRSEAWKYTPLTPLARARFNRPGAASDAVNPHVYGGFECHELVFVDGRYVPSLSSVGARPNGVLIGSLAEAVKTHPDRVTAHVPSRDESPFDALNTALMEDGAFVYVPRDTAVDTPIHLLFIGRGAAALHPRNIVIAERGAKLVLIETFVGDESTYFTNAVTDVYVGESARVDHLKVQREGLEAFHIANLRVHAARNATFRSFFVSTGGRLVRNEIHAPLQAEGIEFVMHGLFKTDGQQHVDCHTYVSHDRPRCKSEQVYKGLLDGASHGVFSGTVYVAQDAQKTDAHQSNKNLLLSDSATVNTRPQLQIHADDVKCTHGVAIGSLDETQSFYLRSRGIGPEEAREMLIYAFASELLAKIEIDAVRQEVQRHVCAGIFSPIEEETWP